MDLPDDLELDDRVVNNHLDPDRLAVEDHLELDHPVVKDHLELDLERLVVTEDLEMNVYLEMFKNILRP